MTGYDFGDCSYCERKANKYKSGVPICWLCWEYVKLDRPAAQHWVKVLEPVFSNVDFYDQMTYFPAAGTSAGDTLVGCLRTLVRSQLLLKYGPEHTWPEKVWNLLGGKTQLIDIAFPA